MSAQFSQNKENQLLQETFNGGVLQCTSPFLCCLSVISYNQSVNGASSLFQPHRGHFPFVITVEGISLDYLNYIMYYLRETLYLFIM